MKTEEIMREICCGNSVAESLCKAWFRWCHWIDDAQDRDVKYTAADSVVINLEALATFSANPFFQEHRHSLLGLMLAAIAAWEESMEWATRPDECDRRASDVLKGYYHEVFWEVARLIGGWQHARAMRLKFRTVNYDAH